MNTTPTRARLLLWWFLFAAGADVPKVMGPFTTAEQCAYARSLLVKPSAPASPCWSDGR